MPFALVQVIALISRISSGRHKASGQDCQSPESSCGCTKRQGRAFSLQKTHANAQSVGARLQSPENSWEARSVRARLQFPENSWEGTKRQGTTSISGKLTGRHEASGQGFQSPENSCERTKRQRTTSVSRKLMRMHKASAHDFQSPENSWEGTKRQGTTSVVPQEANSQRGFSP